MCLYSWLYSLDNFKTVYIETRLFIVLITAQTGKTIIYKVIG